MYSSTQASFILNLLCLRLPGAEVTSVHYTQLIQLLSDVQINIKLSKM